MNSLWNTTDINVDFDIVVGINGNVRLIFGPTINVTIPAAGIDFFLERLQTAVQMSKLTTNKVAPQNDRK